MDQLPDVVDDVFLLAARALSYAPYAVFNPQVLPVLVTKAELGLLAQHRYRLCLAFFSLASFEEHAVSISVSHFIF